MEPILCFKRRYVWERPKVCTCESKRRTLICRTYCAEIHRPEVKPWDNLTFYHSNAYLRVFFSPSRKHVSYVNCFFFWSNRHSSGWKLLPFVSQLFIVTEKSCGFNRGFQPQLPQFGVSVMLTHLVRFRVWQGISRIFQFFCSQAGRGKLDSNLPAYSEVLHEKFQFFVVGRGDSGDRIWSKRNLNSSHHWWDIWWTFWGKMVFLTTFFLQTIFSTQSVLCIIDSTYCVLSQQSRFYPLRECVYLP